MKGEPWPARNVSATVFFSTFLPCVAVPNMFMSLPPSIGVESEFVTIPGGDHGFTRSEDRARAESLMVAWFERLLSTP